MCITKLDYLQAYLTFVPSISGSQLLSYIQNKVEIDHFHLCKLLKICEHVI